ncbi:hypothetical protein NLM27_26105 [Bradyrhizobium sp. CCGB12]|nr:hypothetical protein [Bradyrhizobium sp. CCGB12]
MHPYSDLLYSSVPELRQGWLDGIGGAVLREAGSALANEGRGKACSFFERCAFRIAGRCDIVPTPVRRLSKGADIRCQRSEMELTELSAQRYGVTEYPMKARMRRAFQFVSSGTSTGFR